MTSWLQTHQAVVHPWWCDRFGHMNVRFYAHVFDDAGFVLWPMAGVNEAMFTAAQVHTVVAHTSTDFDSEVVVGKVVVVRSRFTAIGTKSVTYEQQLFDIENTEMIHARQRVVEVCFDPKTRSSRPIPDSIRSALQPLVG